MSYCLIFEHEEQCKIVAMRGGSWGLIENDIESISTLHHIAIPNCVEFLACDISRLPNDSFFRDAWRKGDLNEPIKIDLGKATQIHRKRLSEASQSKIAQLTLQLAKALEIDDLPQSVAIRRTIHILRSLSEKMDLTHCKNVDDIKRSIPPELHDVWTWYNPQM